jgi:hypothetical protein
MPDQNPETRNRRGCIIFLAAFGITLLLIYLFASWSTGDRQQANEAISALGVAGGG